MKTYFRVSAAVSSDEYETVFAQLYANDLQGCEESTDDDNLIRIRAYFLSETTAYHIVDILRTIVCHTDQIEIVVVANEDWNDAWRKSMQPVQLAPSWWVSPLWLPPPQMPHDHWIKIEPKMAFGTGHHETTRLAAQALINVSAGINRGVLLDIGTGSGVLCFTGALLGAARCIGVEIDADCRENIAENRALNRDSGSVQFLIGSIEALKSSPPRFNVIVMNMLHTESAPLLVKCSTLLIGQGTLIWSGILNNERDAAIAAAKEAGFHLRTHQVENEWWCGVFIFSKQNSTQTLTGNQSDI